jgi:hypothetical protein
MEIGKHATPPLSIDDKIKTKLSNRLYKFSMMSPLSSLGWLLYSEQDSPEMFDICEFLISLLMATP